MFLDEQLHFGQDFAGVHDFREQIKTMDGVWVVEQLHRLPLLAQLLHVPRMTVPEQVKTTCHHHRRREA
ncbi:hypothetical protein PR202_ga21005 [Eleusine coracana subsp. coracana]|uniref:Uncharacterized protein n=1 Tax=Eleusine coracana subsp. coracana TaxID=191504 RepID=A0AAV5D0G3_ELECO|nr:hypothetical protein PR202_ga21005 [Eleusine coracana subsp. coracana]